MKFIRGKYDQRNPEGIEAKELNEFASLSLL